MAALLFAAAIIMAAVAGALLVHAYVLPRLRFETHLRNVESYGFGLQRDDGEFDVGVVRGSLNGAIDALARRIGRLVARAIPALAPMRRGELTAAGHYELSPKAVHGYRTLAALLGAVLPLAYAATTGAVSLLAIAAAVLLAVLGWQLPALALRMQGRARLDRIDHDLPQLIDMIVATVEAGSAFAGALGGVTGRFDGPLGDELRLAMRQQSLGISTEQALGDLVARCDTESLRAFVRTVVRAEAHGTSIGPVMRHLAADIRKRRRDAAREKIQKAPIKMLFPLALLILPALLLVILYPALHNIIHTLSG